MEKTFWSGQIELKDRYFLRWPSKINCHMIFSLVDHLRVHEKVSLSHFSWKCKKYCFLMFLRFNENTKSMKTNDFVFSVKHKNHCFLMVSWFCLEFNIVYREKSHRPTSFNLNSAYYLGGTWAHGGFPLWASQNDVFWRGLNKEIDHLGKHLFLKLAQTLVWTKAARLGLWLHSP